MMKDSSKHLVSGFIGLAAGLCAIVALIWGPGPGFLMTILKIEDPSWTRGWADALTPASAAQEVAFAGLMNILLLVLLLAAAAAAVCGALVLAGERLAASRTLAIRAALGIDLRFFVRSLVREVWVRGRRAGVVAFGVMLFGGLLIRGTWPDRVLGWSLLDAGLAVAAGGAATAIVLLLTVVPGLAIWRHRRLFAFLTKTSSTLPGRGESLGRDAALVCQVAVAVSVLVLIGGLVGSSPGRSGLDTLGEDTVAIPMEMSASASGPERIRQYQSLLAEMAARPDVEAESIASPGALLGLGASGIVVADCGECIKGLMYVPFSIVDADHHTVGPGFFGLTGFEIVAGREFESTDVAGSPRVAIVNKSFADEHFERGRPLGRSVQVGGPRGDWFDVVGVVQEPPAVAMGAQSSRRPALYLSALQMPPARSTLIVRPSSTAESDLEAFGNVVRAAIPSAATAGRPRTVAAVRQTSRAPVSWLSRALLVVVALALFVVIISVHTVMRVSAERSAPELGLRMAVGATPARITRLVIRRSLSRFAWGTWLGLFFGMVLLGGLQGVIPRVSPPSMEWILAWTVLLAVIAVWGAWAPARNAAGRDPARVLVEG